MSLPFTRTLFAFYLRFNLCFSSNLALNNKQTPLFTSNMFFELYWHYIATVLLGYLLSRGLYVYLKYGKIKRNVIHNFKTPDEIAEDNEENDNDDVEEDCIPALPKNLKHIPFVYNRLSEEEMKNESDKYFQFMNKRRSVRNFSSDPVPKEVLYNIIKTAGTGPSGAHTEPWTFALITSLNMKQKIKEIIESEEEINYKKRMGKIWTTDLKPFKTNWVKEYLTTAPALILVFKQMYSFRDDGKKKLHYYNEQSVGIATGILISAIHVSGLVSLISTPLNCGPSLRTLLNRPNSEKLIYLLPLGYPADDSTVPDLKRKDLQDIMEEY
ncbi:iodotyrosine deiodinase 1 isoform X1 [Onthophagus taurus]|uniref:iodotyrosine deiodinase 1 isoform X1 n=2 Tax=Onthophagus taurus TaxID=166361 RepID=UPI0039BE1643